MRMWMVPPHLLCDRHLLGEHVELHMMEGTLRKHLSITGYVEQRITQPRSLHDRHEALVTEMEKRGMRHRSPLKTDRPTLLSLLSSDALRCTVDVLRSLTDLSSRCPDCRRRQAGDHPPSILPCLRKFH